MYNDKLIDAIGLIDDNFIDDAKKIKKQSSFYTALIASVLIVTLIPASLFGGMIFFASLRANSVAPMYKYSFNTNELLDLRKTAFQVNNTNSGSVSPPLNNIIGANPIEIHYADDLRVIFTTENGVFEFVRYSSDYIESSYSLDKMEIPGFNQGDKATNIQVDKNGEYAILVSSENMSQWNAEYEYRTISFTTTGAVTVIENIPENFSPFPLSENIYSHTNDIYYDNDAFLSSNMASYTDKDGNNVDCFIKVSKDKEKGYILGNAELVEARENDEYKTYRLFG